MIRHYGPISGVAAYGTQYVATAGYDNQLILWDAATKQPLARVNHDHLANQAAFSPDGRFLVSSSSDYSARLWSLPKLSLVAVLADHKDDVEMSVFHPTKELIATASRDHNVRVYDFTGTLITTFEGHTADVISVEWVAGTDELVSSSDDGTIKRWSLETGGMTDEIDLAGVETDTVAIARTGVIYAGNDEGEIIVVNGERVENHPAHEAGIKRLVYNAERDLLVSLSYDRTLRVWDTSADLTEVARASLPSDIWPRSCAFLDSDTLAFATFGSSYATYRIGADEWNVDGVEQTPCVNAVTVDGGRTLTIGDAGVLWIDGERHSETGSLCNFLTPVGGRVLTGGQMGKVFDALTGEVLHQHRSPLNCGAAFERDGVPHVVIGAYTGEGIVLSVAADGSVRHEATLQLHQNAVKGVAVSEGRIFSVCADASTTWFSVDDLEQLHHIEEAHERIANGCAPLPGGDFASVSRDYKLRLWRGFEPTVIATPHDHSIKCVAASTDGRYVATGSYHGLVAVYDVAADTWSTVSRVTTAGISSLFYDADTDRFLAGSYDGRVYPVSSH
ncbi:WD40 repeat domain-containing protein [Streptomyces sp. NPDC006307]|uniref:WD40 repeat domain-containing protein n=1 Tax=Streptomyces sp. NPDC006307 TaxID=3156748 RepID=UPI0033A2CA18